MAKSDISVQDILAGDKTNYLEGIQVPAKYSFWDFHVAIQDAMGSITTIRNRKEHYSTKLLTD